MSILLIQSVASPVVVYLQETGGAPAEGLSASDLSVGIRKVTGNFVPKVLAPTVAATAEIGSGVDGTVTASVAGTAGNLFTIEVVVPGGTSALTATTVGTVITVSLATVLGVPDAPANRADAVAAALTASSPLVIGSFSGTGATSLTIAEGPTALGGGVDGDIYELGQGFYELDLSATDTNTLGNLWVSVGGTTVRQTLLTAQVVATAAVAPPSVPLSVSTSSLFGTILDSAGAPKVNATVTARILARPTVLSAGADAVVVTTETITARTDSSGFFTMTLITGTTIDLSIPVANYRRTLVVPATATNVFDIP